MGQQQTPGKTAVLTKDELGKYAKPGCRRCYGRGWTGKMSDGRVLLCRCAQTGVAELMRARIEAARAGVK